MNENQTKIYEFETKINDDGSINLPINKIKELKENGFNEIMIVVYGSAIYAAQSMELDLDLFEKIKEVQGLPDAVILDLLKSKGSMTNSNSLKKLNY